MSEQQKMLRCFLDGTALCIVTDEFTDLQESDVMFIDLTPNQIEEYERLELTQEDE
jgi:hypothetical protein